MATLTNPLAPAAEVYGRKVGKSRTYSAVSSPEQRYSSRSRLLTPPQHNPQIGSVGSYVPPGRRASADTQGNIPRIYQVQVEDTLRTLLEREDTDHNVQITIDDHGPKTISLGTAASGGYRRSDVRGTYMLSNLLQELTLASK